MSTSVNRQTKTVLHRHRRSLIRYFCRALRHTPAEFGVALDEHGGIEFDALLYAARRFQPASIVITREQIERMIAGPHHDRLEHSQGRIRARYGHSVSGVTTGVPGIPPNPLFHGTPAAWVTEIVTYGPRPRGRDLVQLTRTSITRFESQAKGQGSCCPGCRCRQSTWSRS